MNKDANEEQKRSDIAYKKTEIDKETINAFLNSLNVRKASEESYKKALRQFVKWLQTNKIKQPTRENIIQYRNEKKTSCQPATVQAYITAVKLFFQWTEQECIYPNIAKQIKGAKVDTGHKKDFFETWQVKKILDKTKGEDIEALRNYAILILLFTSGVRCIEITRANICDIQELDQKTILRIQGKGHEQKTDYVFLVKETQEAIFKYLNAREEKDSRKPLFIAHSNNAKGKRLTTRSISEIAKKAFKKAGFNSERLTAHSARHTAITLALLGGVNFQEVQQFARHSNINTTKIYAHNIERMSNKCETTIAQAIFHDIKKITSANDS